MVRATVPHFVLLFFLGGIFLHFLLAAGRTFHTTTRASEAQFSRA